MLGEIDIQSARKKLESVKMAEAVVDLLSTENPVLKAYLFWSAVLVLKMLFMSLLTAMQRFRTKVIAITFTLLSSLESGS